MPSPWNKSQIERAKKAASIEASKYVQDGMIVGLGTGSTATFLIDALIEKAKGGLRFQAVSSSKRSAKQAKEGGIEVLDLNDSPPVDLTIDGADEIDPHLNLIKGGGAAHLREKLVAIHSKEMLVIADGRKLVSQLGTFPLPIEIVPFAYKKTIGKLKEMGYPGVMRIQEGKLVVTDNGNYIYDIKPKELFSNPLEDHKQLIEVPGVIETGFFIGIAKKALVGLEDGQVKEVLPE